jgi:hypothetical protein
MSCCDRLKFAARFVTTRSRWCDRAELILFYPRLSSFALALRLLWVTMALLWSGSHVLAQDESLRVRFFQLDNGQIRLDWEGGRPPYRVQACTDTILGWLDISDYIFGYSYTGPALGDVACLRVRTAPDFLSPLAPEGLAVHAVRCTRVAIGWQQARDDADGVGLLGYRLYRDGVPIIEMADPATFFLDRNVLPDHSYSYTVTAFDFLGNESEASAPVLVSTPPCIGEANGPEREAILVWDPSDERQVAGYLVYWGVRPGEYLWAMDAMDSNSATISDLLPGVAYFFAVTAYNREGEQSDLSSETAYITQDPYGIPGN